MNLIRTENLTTGQSAGTLRVTSRSVVVVAVDRGSIPVTTWSAVGSSMFDDFAEDITFSFFLVLKIKK